MKQNNSPFILLSLWFNVRQMLQFILSQHLFYFIAHKTNAKCHTWCSYYWPTLQAEFDNTEDNSSQYLLRCSLQTVVQLMTSSNQ